MSKPDGGPAFPSHGSMGEVAQEGMSLRDYFATKMDRDEYGDIMFRHMSRNAEETLLKDKYPEEPPACATNAEKAAYRLSQIDWDLRVRAAIRFRMADAMLAEREK